MSDYGKTMKEIRKVCGYTQTQLAKETDIVRLPSALGKITSIYQVLIAAYGLPTFTVSASTN